MLVIIFSKNRALQLDATLKSLFTMCEGADKFNVAVLYKTTSDLHEKQYNFLKSEYTFVNFIKEHNFKSDFLKLVTSLNGYVMFLTDDTIFTKEFSIKDIIDQLAIHYEAIGFSLRLGLNTTKCYMLNRNQLLPAMIPIEENILRYDWTNADADFGYPLELSSSVYRVGQLLLLFNAKEYHNPNSLESAMWSARTFFKHSLPELLCYKVSVAFSNPCNLVQDKKTNRHGIEDAEELALKFVDGYRLDIEKYRNLVTNSVHQEEPLYYKGI